MHPFIGFFDNEGAWLKFSLPVSCWRWEAELGEQPYACAPCLGVFLASHVTGSCCIKPTLSATWLTKVLATGEQFKLLD